ncbi:hypothetical protein [Cupriavidus necator]|nr:hypothetical protein [Cupriavidus necator]
MATLAINDLATCRELAPAAMARVRGAGGQWVFRRRCRSAL